MNDVADALTQQLLAMSRAHADAFARWKVEERKCAALEAELAELKKESAKT